MLAKMVTCIVCGNEVSKRSTLLIEGGRACRDHEEVKAWQELRQLQEDMAKVDEHLKVIALAAGVRMTHSLARTPVEELYWRIGSRWGRGLARKVREAVDGQGGPLMTAAEVTVAVAEGLRMRATMARMQKEAEG